LPGESIFLGRWSLEKGLRSTKGFGDFGVGDTHITQVKNPIC
jgi:hypothetical protein